MTKLTAKDQIVLVLCHLMGKRRSMDVGNWVIEMKDNLACMVFEYVDGKIYNGSTYSRKWRELKGEDYRSWWWDKNGSFFLSKKIKSKIEPQFTPSTNTWHLPREFCKFLRAEKDRILKEMK
jgi:hypothetical protein